MAVPIIIQTVWVRVFRIQSLVIAASESQVTGMTKGKSIEGSSAILVNEDIAAIKNIKEEKIPILASIQQASATATRFPFLYDSSFIAASPSSQSH